MSPEVGGSFVDLHTHTTASDGILPPERVVEAAASAGVSAIAITDHDTVAGVPEAEAAGVRLGVRVVRGVELSASLGEHEIHVLALHLSRLDRIEQWLADLRNLRLGRARLIVEKLNSLGLALSMEDVLEAAGGGAVGRPHIARAMIARGFAADLRDAFQRYLRAGARAFVPKEKLSVADAVKIAHEAGALAIWAHPGSGGRRERLEALMKDGLDGAEILHPSHSSEDTVRIRALVEFFTLLPSGGSDWHGMLDGPRKLGMMNVPLEWLERQDARKAHVNSPGAA